MKFRKSIIMFLLGLAVALPLTAAFLRNIPVKVVQPNGEPLNLFATGDEFYNWLHDADGYTIIQDPKTGFYVYAVLEDGRLAPSSYPVSSLSAINKASVSYLNIPKYLIQPWDKRTKPQDIRPGGSAANPEKILRAPRTGTLNNIAIFIRFSDESEFADALSLYSNMFNSSTSGANSMSNYFRESSYNQLTITTSFYPISATATVLSYQDSRPRSYFQPYNASTNPDGYSGETQRTEREHTLLKNAVNSVSSSIPPGLNVDGDGDGYVDNVCFIVYGGPTAWATLLWPHMWSLYSQTAYINGKRVYTYNFQLQTSLQSSGVGVLCHEMFHSLGAPDLYHYSLDGFQPAYKWDIMENNLNPPQHMSAYMKYKYGGWISSIPQIILAGDYSLTDLTSATNNCYKIASPNSTTEYFVVEHRYKGGTFENSLPGSGLLIYRINPAYTGNANGPPDEVYVYRPNGTRTVNGSPSLANFGSHVGRTAINDATNPWSFLTAGGPGGLNISNIGSPSGAPEIFDVVYTPSSMSFNVAFPPPVTAYTIQVGATPDPATITVSPNDFNGEGNGTTGFSRIYSAGTVVTFTAPQNVNGRNFSSWSLNGAPLSTNQTVQVIMSQNHTLVTNYGGGVDLGEALDNAALTWSAGGGGWYGQTVVYYYGNDAAQSVDIDNNGECILQTAVLGPGTLSFYWKVSSEANYDFLRFYIDNVEQSGKISGAVTWQQKTFSIGTGSHVLKWSYQKDSMVSNGSDAGWVDWVQFAYAGGTGRFNSAGSWTGAGRGSDGWYVGDFNGDGRSDIMRYNPGVSGAEVFLSNGSSFVDAGSWTGAGNGADGWHLGDFNGDGRTDIFRYYPGVSGAEVFLSDGTKFVEAGSWTGAGCGSDGWYIGDFNGDGRSDIFRYYPGVSGAEVFLSNGTNQFVYAGSWTGAGKGNENWYVGDFNGDGRTDIFRYYLGYSGADVFLSNGTQFGYDGSWTGAGNGADGWYIGDFNGDGRDDIFRYYPGVSGADMFLSGAYSGPAPQPEAMMFSQASAQEKILSEDEEQAFLKPFLDAVKTGGSPSLIEIKKAYERRVGRAVSTANLNRLLGKHNYWKLWEQAHGTKKRR